MVLVEEIKCWHCGALQSVLNTRCGECGVEIAKKAEVQRAKDEHIKKSRFRIEADLRRAEAELLDFYDLTTGEQIEDPSAKEREIAMLEAMLANKRDTYIRMLKDGFFKRQKDKIAEKKKELQREEEWLTRKEEEIKGWLNRISSSSEEVLVVKSDISEKPEFYIVPTVNVTRTVDVTKLAPSEGYYSPKLSAKQTLAIKELISKKGNTTELDIAILETLDSSDRSCPVTELAEDHPAILKNIKPTVNITKSKPKSK